MKILAKWLHAKLQLLCHTIRFVHANMLGRLFNVLYYGPSCRHRYGIQFNQFKKIKNCANTQALTIISLYQKWLTENASHFSRPIKNIETKFRYINHNYGQILWAHIVLRVCSSSWAEITTSAAEVHKIIHFLLLLDFFWWHFACGMKMKWKSIPKIHSNCLWADVSEKKELEENLCQRK